MRPEAVAVLDIGKTNLKVLAVAEDGRILAAASRPAAARDGALDTEAAWSFALEGLRDLAARFSLTAIVPTTHGCAAALVCRGELAHPVVDYEAAISDEVSAAYDAVRPAFAETFSPPLPAGLNLGRQLFRIARERPEALASAEALLTYPQYWAWRLSGVKAAEATSLACHADLWQPLSGRPSSLLPRMGWDRLLPPLLPAFARLGPPRPELGLPADCSVLSGIHDSNAAWLRYLAGAEAPLALVSTGTWIVCFNSAGDPTGLDPARDTLANVDARGRPVTCARFMGGREYTAIARRARPNGTATVAAARELVGRGVLALPSFVEAGGPFPGRRGRIVGVVQDGDEAAALASLYAALMTRESLALTGPVSRVFVDGPFAGNALYLAALTSLMPQATILASRITEGAAVGASLLARWPARADALPRLALDAEPVSPLPFALDGYAARWSALAGVEGNAA